jgi:hypothetical protein
MTLFQLQVLYSIGSDGTVIMNCKKEIPTYAKASIRWELLRKTEKYMNDDNR